MLEYNHGSVSQVSPVPSVPPAPDKLTSKDFPVLWPVGTRWADNDMFGHLNNAVYYQLFDTAINAWINTDTGLDPITTPALGIVAESGCRYFSELQFPGKPRGGPSGDPAGAQQCHLPAGGVPGRAARADDPHDPDDPDDVAQPITALGHWVHVYVDRTPASRCRNSRRHPIAAVRRRDRRLMLGTEVD